MTKSEDESGPETTVTSAQRQRAILSRRGVRGHVTRLVATISEILENEDFDLDELEEKLSLLVLRRDRCLQLDSEVQELTPTEELEREVEDSLLYADKLDADVHRVKRYLAQARSQTSGSATSPDTATSSTQGPRSTSARLPKLSLPTFSGDVLEFTTYIELFDVNVHELSSLTDIQKFSYLRTTLEGEPATLISNLELTSANYAIARNVLVDRYGDKAKIIEEHYRRLLRLDPKRESHQDLREFFNQLELHVRGLAAQGREQETYGDLLAMILMDKLSADLRRCLARDHREKTWTLANLIEMLRRELLVMEQDGRTGVKSQSPAVQTTSTFYSDSQRGPKLQGKGNTRPHSNKQGGSRSNENTKRDVRCHLCSGAHKAPDCTTFATVDARLQEAKVKGLCFNCLQSHTDGTRAKDCKGGNCRVCNSKHHTALHRTRPLENEKRAQVDKNQRAVQNNFVDGSSGGTLKTFTGEVAFGGKIVKASILLDDGSTDSFCTEQLAKRLQLPQTSVERFAISRFGSLDHEEYHYPTSPLTLKTLDGDVPMKVVIVPRICKPTSPRAPRLTEGDVEKLKGLVPARNVRSGTDIDLLIASDFYYAVVKDTIIHLDCGLVAVDTRYGYLLCGGASPVLTTNFVEVTRLQDQRDEQLIEWQDPQTSVELSDGDEHLLEGFFAELTRNDNGQYVAKLPFLPTKDKSQIPRNRGVAYHRSRTMVERFASDETALSKLKAVFSDYLKRGFIEKTSDVDLNNPHHSFLPWQAVYKATSVHTKMRIVFDCSCRDKMTGASLNDFLWKGPNLANNLVQILLRFRLPAVAIAADIEKAFLAIQIREEDRQYLRFFYLDNPEADDTSLAVYNFKVNIFGSRASSFILAAVLQKHLSLYTSPVARDMEVNILVDNVVTGVPDTKAALKYFDESRKIFCDAAMNLREWSSNDPQLRGLADSNGASGPAITHVLGVTWDTSADSISLRPFVPQVPRFWTKRRMLSEFHKIFDPYGWLAPLTIAAKLALQTVWKLGINWDDRIPDDLGDQWNLVLGQLKNATATAARRILPNKDNKYELDIFVDSSLQAYCAAAYLNGHLLCAKAKTAPLKQRTIPELELMAMVLGTTLAKFLCEALEKSCVTVQPRFYSDSQVCLAWITSDKTLRPFVANRVRIIKDAGAAFRYVPTALNPADYATRGTLKLMDSELWWKGPQREQLEAVCVPHDIPDASSTKEEPTYTREAVCCTVDRTVNPTRFSTLTRLVRSAALAVRFTRKLKRKATASGPPCPEEMTEAFLLVLRESQADEFPEILSCLTQRTPKKHHLVQQLRLFMDDRGVIRCAGRFARRDACTEDERAPVLLGKDALARLIVLDCHARSLHGGVGSTLVLLRTQFWMTGGRRFIRSLLRSCVACRRVGSRAYAYPTSPPLPNFRVNKAPPFNATGIDYTGHLLVKTSDGVAKRYIALFACCVTRAVHLEVAEDLTAEHFMLLFRRFCARRSLPATIVTDNAAYFNSGRDELQEILADEGVAGYLNAHKVSWINIPGRSPAWGGLYERLIGVMKMTLKKVLGRALVTNSELITIVAEVEAAVNNRPLTYFEDADDPSSTLPLTPSHLLHGRVLQSLPYVREVESTAGIPSSYDTKEAQERVAYRGALLEQLWRRWSHEYLSALRERHIKTPRLSSLDTPRVGDVVQVFDDTPRTTWRLGRITELLPGDDGAVRAVKLMTNGHLVTRAVNKLYPLEFACDEPNFQPERTDGKVPAAKPENRADEQDERFEEATREDTDAAGAQDPPVPTGRARRAAFNKAKDWLKEITSELSGGGSMS